MRKLMIVVLIIAVIGLVAGSVYYGVIPGLGLFDFGTETQSYTIEEVRGCSKGWELIGPLDRKGFICSYKADGFSEIISARGKLTWANEDYGYWVAPEKYRYKIYLKENAFSSYELLSQPGSTSKYFSSPNPGNIALTVWGLLQPYDFQIVGNKYAGGSIKVQLEAYYDKSAYDGEGPRWYIFAVDEAYLYSGYGGLYLPTGLEDGIERPYSTFEIGQEVRIGVETAKGGTTLTGEDTWRVTLNAPFSGNIDDPNDGGGLIVEQFFPDDCDASNTFFVFTVTADMAQRSMDSPYPYTIRIWNTLLPRGTLQIDFVDFIKLCPGNVDFEGPTKIKVGEYASVKLSATVNTATQASIDYFRVAVIYGTNDVLLPSDHSSEKWIIHTTNAGNADKTPCSIPQSISFKADHEGYVTVHAKAFDVQGRPSKTTRTFTIYAWGESGEPPDETIEDEVGDHDYWGGHTDDWIPWDPSGGDWEDPDEEFKLDTTGLIIAVAIIAVFAVIAFLFPGKNPYIMISLIIVGVAIAVIQYIYFFMG